MGTTDLSQIDVAVLAGGLGTRLRSVLPDRPKVLAPVDGRPYLDFLLDWLVCAGFRRVVLCLGYRADAVQVHLSAFPRADLTVDIVIEPAPAGTAGALRHAAPALRSDPVMVMNGDSFVDGNLRDFVAAHQARRPVASILCAEVADASRYGRIDLTADGLVRQFAEKDPAVHGPGLINAGVYLFATPILEEIAKNQAESLERDVFPSLVSRGVHGQVTAGTFLDIGTPESLEAAPRILSRYRKMGGWA
ncbi:MAG: nucleotidyltransferase family protein [Alphaproteobacteria bacterium]|nr:nucleotidyltransferase family protein [Alphaproteobacteria bacterium]